MFELSDGNFKKLMFELTRKVFISHPDNDDTHGKVGGLDDGSHGQVQVRDDAISQNQEDKVVAPVLK